MALFLIAACVPLFQHASAAILNLNEGASCSALDGGRGVCTLLRKCRDPGDFRRDHPPICMFDGKEPYICCPPTLSLSPPAGLRANQYCNLNNSTCIRSMEDTLAIIEEKQSKPKMKSYIALIGYGPFESNIWGCEGSVINERYILTAAHCANTAKSGRAKRIRLGQISDLTQTNGYNLTQDIPISKVIVHPSFKQPEMNHDIALLKLDRDIHFNERIGPVCLHSEKEIPPAEVVAWTMANSGTQLLEVYLDIYNNTYCEETISKLPNDTRGLGNSQYMFCTKKKDPGNNLCLQGSGGPLVAKSPNHCEKLIGVASNWSCGVNPHFPQVFTRISNYLSWIEDIAFFNLTKLIQFK